MAKFNATDAVSRFASRANTGQPLIPDNHLARAAGRQPAWWFNAVDGLVARPFRFLLMKLGAAVRLSRARSG